jgi:multidrug efflux pump subunit AcrB
MKSPPDGSAISRAHTEQSNPPKKLERQLDSPKVQTRSSSIAFCSSESSDSAGTLTTSTRRGRGSQSQLQSKISKKRHKRLSKTTANVDAVPANQEYVKLQVWLKGHPVDLEIEVKSLKEALEAARD